MGAAAVCAYGIHRRNSYHRLAATRAGRATNSVAEMGSAMGTIDTELIGARRALLLAAPEG